MTVIQADIPSQLDTQLSQLADKLQVSKESCIVEALAIYIEDKEDVLAAAEGHDPDEETITLEEFAKKHIFSREDDD